MAIAAYPATVKIGANTVQDIQTFEVPMKMNMIQTTAFGGSGGAAIGNETYVAGLFSAVLKAVGSWNKADTTGQALIETAFFARTTVTLIFSPNGTNTYTAPCLVSDYIVKADVKNKVDVDISFTVNGAVTPA